MEKHRETFRVRSYETDTTGALSISALGNYLQETAVRHADSLGFGVADLMKDNATWMLSQLQLRVTRLPGKGEGITVTTWPSGIRKLFAMRDFVIEDEQGEPIGAASTAWLVVDIAARRPLRPEKTLEGIVFPPKAFEHDFTRPSGTGNNAEGTVLVVRAHDLDGNNHVNNVSYLTWILDAISVPPFSAGKDDKRLSEFSIHYLREAFLGDSILVVTQVDAADPAILHHTVRRETAGDELVTAFSRWTNLESEEFHARG